MRLVCPESFSATLANKLKIDSSSAEGKSSLWTRYPYPWTEGLVFGTWAADDRQTVSDLTECVTDLIHQGYTAGIMGVKAIKALFFDMDATVIVEESLVEIAAERGVSAEIHRITELAMEGKLDFKEALLQRVLLLKGTPKKLVERIGPRLTLQPGIIPLVDRAKKNNIKCYMVSGGFTILADPIGRTVGMDGVYANTFGFEDNALSGQIEGDIVDANGKKHFLEKTCQALKMTTDETIAIGDGANDIPLVSTAGFGVGFCPKQALRSAVHFQNQKGDHRLLEYFLFGSIGETLS
jgi:phosphoserine phosphatase